MRAGRDVVWVLVVSLSLAGCSRGDEPAGEREEAVIQAFEDYRAALLAQDGAAAAELAATDTLDYYEEMRDLALEAPRAEMKRRRLTDQLNALMFRHLLEPGELRRMDGKDLVEFGVDEGLISETSVARVEPGEAEAEGERAVLEIEIDGERAPISYQFALEEGRWKIDFTDLLKVGDTALQVLADQSGMSEEAYVMQLLTSQSGTRPPKTIWEPIQR